MNLAMMSKEMLFDKLKKLNIKAGDIVLVSSDLSSKDLHIALRLNLIDNLISYLGSEGSIIMSLSGDNFDPRYIKGLSKNQNNAKVRKLMPGYSKDEADIYAQETLSKTLLLKAGCVISDSISYPYIGIGKYAKLVLQQQSNNFPNGNMSPLARLYELRAKVLLINQDKEKLSLNKYVFETDASSLISINGGKVKTKNESGWFKYLEKVVNQEKLAEIITTSKYRRLFYQANLNDIELSQVSVRDYVDYCRNYLKGD